MRCICKLGSHDSENVLHLITGEYVEITSHTVFSA